jgi:hypothetical protein
MADAGVCCAWAQLRSANKFLRMASIKEWILIAPEAKVSTLVHYLEDKLPHLPCVLVSKVGDLLPSQLQADAIPDDALHPRCRLVIERVRMTRQLLLRMQTSTELLVVRPPPVSKGTHLHACLQQMRVVSDEACVPELRPEPFRNITGDMSYGVSGWIKQQLIKLACSLTVQVCFTLSMTRSLSTYYYLFSTVTMYRVFQAYRTPPAHIAACAGAAERYC